MIANLESSALSVSACKKEIVYCALTPHELYARICVALTGIPVQGGLCVVHFANINRNQHIY
jgi:hypothetical protein